MTPTRRGGRLVVRRRRLAAIAGLAILFGLAGVATTLEPGRPSVNALSSGGQAEQALRTLERSGLGAGALTPVELLTDGPLSVAQHERVATGDQVRAVLAPDGGGWSRGRDTVTLALLRADAASDGGGPSRCWPDHCARSCCHSRRSR